MLQDDAASRPRSASARAAAAGAAPGRSWSGRWAWLLGLGAGLTVVATLDGPGLTVDEPLDVRPGRTYLAVLQKQGRHFFDRDVVEKVFRDNAEHPPLGRWLLGIASVLGEPFEVLLKGKDPTDHYVLAGRLAPALTFAALVGLVAGAAGRRWGTPAGVAAGFAMAILPRSFAHAHFGALDTFLSFFWTAALLAGERALRSPRPVRAMAVAGAVWSLALLIKIHAWFLIPLLGIWSLVRLGLRRALGAMAVWFVVGVSLYWAGWPWLWYDTGNRLRAYWGTGVARTTILVEYLGRVYADRDVPWHYPWVYFAATVPVGLHALGLIGLARAGKDRRREPFPLLLVGSILFFLVLFSTRIPVYDGERLFLHVFPAWALLIGFGFGWLWETVFTSRRGRVLLGGILAAQAIGVVSMHPFGLSYYNALVGGLPGARWLGLELTYWSDAIDRVLLDRLARAARPGSSAAMAPTLYPGQGIETTGFHRGLARRGLILQDDPVAAECEWVVLSHRRAYLRDNLMDRLHRRGRLVATRSRWGVELSALWHVPSSSD